MRKLGERIGDLLGGALVFCLDTLGVPDHIMWS